MREYFKLQYPTIFVLIIILITIISCRKVHIYEGKAIIISRSIDLTLQDSVLVFGTVNSSGDKSSPELNTTVWMEGTSIKTTVDNLGAFSIKLAPGTYTIKGGYEDHDDLIEELKNVRVLPNEKMHVQFLIKEVIE